MNKTFKALLISIPVIAVIIAGGQYASCDSVICDYLGRLSGWFKDLLQKGQNLASEATSAGASAFDLALDLISGFEGFRSKAYPDQAGYLTIGYGHKIVPGDGFSADSVISESEARDLLSQDASSAQICVNSNVKEQLTAKQEAALISLCYNIGCGAFASSTLLKDVNNGDWQSAESEFSRWVYAKGVVLSGLINRRQQEAAVFAEGSISA